jgi:glycosyltransferase involved in cell wall biosynthesis
MRATHVITRLIVGGAQENTISSVLGLAGIPGVSCDLVSGPSDGPEGSLEHSFSARPNLLRIQPHLVRPIAPIHDVLAYRALRRVFLTEHPDIVHTHSGKAGIIGRLAAHAAHVPVVVHTVHGPSFGPFQGALSNFVFTRAERHAGRSTDHFVVVADAMRDQYLAAGIGRPDQYTTIRSGFDLTPFLSAPNDLNLRASLGIKPTDFVVGKTARLFDLKGHDDLFTIAPVLMKRIPELKFLFVGDGVHRTKFESLANGLGLRDRFVFVGLVPPEQVYRFVGIMDVLVHLSRREGLPRAIPQALAAGKPAVAFDCDGAREVCLDGQTGFLLRAGDLPGLSESLERLARSPELRQRLGLAGQNLVREQFSVERMVSSLHRLYLDLLANTAEKARPRRSVPAS